MSSIRSRALRPEAESVAQCPACKADNPEPTLAALCPSCGAILAQVNRRQIRIALAALAAGGVAILIGAVLLIALGSAAHESGLLTTVIVPLLVLGAAASAYGAFTARKVVNVVTMRDTPEARKLLGRVDLSAVGAMAALVLFCVPAGYQVKIGKGGSAGSTATFDGKLGSFLSIVSREQMGAEIDHAKVGEPRIIGRALVLDMGESFEGVNNGGLSRVHSALPKALRASTPEEVGTVVLLDWKRETAGKYRSSLAYRITCELFLINAADKQVLVKRVFEGGPPPSAVAAGQDGYGSFPNDQIVAYLKGLPQEPLPAP